MVAVVGYCHCDKNRVDCTETSKKRVLKMSETSAATVPAVTQYTTLRLLDWGHIRLSYVAPVYLNKPNSDDVLSIFDDYARLPADILDRVLFVLVDDGSPQPYRLKDWPLNMIVLRVKEDIPWNNPGARNLGMVYAKSDKVFVTDIDHQLDEASWRKILAMPPCGRRAYRFARFAANGQPLRAHANTFLLSRGHFLRHGGYDEELCGSYACDDTLLVKYLKYHGTRFSTLRNGARTTIRDIKSTQGGSTHSLVRDMSRNKQLVARKIEEIWTYGAPAGHSRLFLNFEWEVLRVTRRSVPASQKPDKLWAPSWWLRWLWGE